MSRQLNLDRDQLDQCYKISSYIVSHAAKYIDRHASPAVERATLLFLGIKEEDLFVHKLTKDQLRLGASYWWGRALLSTQEDPKKLAPQLAKGKIRFEDLKEIPPNAILHALEKIAKENSHQFLQAQKKVASFYLASRSLGPALAVAFTDAKGKKLHRSSLDWLKKGAAFVLPHAPSKHFFEENYYFEKELREIWGENKDPKIIPACQGLSFPEQALFFIRSGCKAFIGDVWGDIFSGKIDPKRALIDQSFAFSLASLFGMKILSQHALVVEHLHSPAELLALLLLYEQLANRQGIELDNVMLSHSSVFSESDMSLIKNIAQAQVLREMFPQSILFYRLRQQNPLNFFVASFTEQDVMEFCMEETSGWWGSALGSSQGRSPQGNLDQVVANLKQTRQIGSEFLIEVHGKIARHSHQILDQTWRLLKQMEHATLWGVFEKNLLKIKPESTKPLGGEGVFQKSYRYMNPLLKLCQASASS